MSNDIYRMQLLFQYLKRGVMPRWSLKDLTFGRNAEITAARRMMQAAASGRESGHLFIEGEYGIGKSHLMMAIEEYALDQGFAVSHLVNDSSQCAFNHPLRFMHKIFENVRVQDSTQVGFSSLVKAWLQREDRSKLLEIFRNNLPNSMSWITQYLSNPQNDVANIARILDGRDLMAGATSNYDKFYARINLLSGVVRSLGYQGLLLLFDEVETIVTSLPTIRSRLQSYRLLNNLTGYQSLPQCCFAFSITPGFSERMEEESYRYIEYEAEYPDALTFYRRWKRETFNKVNLKRLTKSESREFFLALRSLHSTAYGWNPNPRVSDVFIDSFIQKYIDRVGSHRELSSSFVHLLEISHQHPHFRPSQILQ